MHNKFDKHFSCGGDLLCVMDLSNPQHHGSQHRQTVAVLPCLIAGRTGISYEKILPVRETPKGSR
jgi:hypothetical protein